MLVGTFELGFLAAYTNDDNILVSGHGEMCFDGCDELR
jgi:hypothetical protein